MKWGKQRTAAAIIAEAGRWVKRRTHIVSPHFINTHVKCRYGILIVNCQNKQT